jgi:hypothetical protein
MSEIGDPKPTSRPGVIELVREAGHDVSDWGDFESGPRSNTPLNLASTLSRRLRGKRRASRRMLDAPGA